MAKKRKVAILYGGRSVEHQVSINSAKNVYQFMDKERFEPVLIGIAQDGSWHLEGEVNGSFDNTKLLLTLDPSHPTFKSTLEEVQPDVVFPILHGTNGEDGSIQGLLQSMDLPFVGTGVLGSSVSMNKLTTKRLLQAAGLPVGRYLAYHFDQKDALDFDLIKEHLAQTGAA